MEDQETKKEDVHVNPATTRWVHKHRTAAKWLVRGLALAVGSLSYYLTKQEKQIEEEVKKK